MSTETSRQRARRLTRDRVTRWRIYQAAVEARHPKALAAEYADKPMKRATDLEAAMKAGTVPKDRDLFNRVLKECQAASQDKDLYLKLRAEAIDAVISMFD